MKKKIMAIISLMLCLACVASCIGCSSSGNDETTPSTVGTEATEKPTDSTEKKTEKPTEAPTEAPETAPILGVSSTDEKLSEFVYDLSQQSANIRYIGRTKATQKGTICDHSASGIEFEGYMTGDVKLKVETRDDVYYTVYIDGKRVNQRFYANGSKVLTIATFEGNYFHKIRILKQSEIGWSQSYLKTLQITGYLSDAPEERDYYIEIYGDSLSSAFGNLGPANASSPTDRPVYQDATQSYGFLLAEAIDADCSIFAMSGVGLATGYYDNPFLHYFSQYSHKSLGEPVSFEGARVPDLAIIHLGANDSTVGCTQAEFMEKAEELIDYIRGGYNTEVPIIWAYDPSEQVPLHWLQELSALYGDEAGGFYLVELEWRSIEYGAGGHPGIKAHEAHADILLNLIVKHNIIK